MGGREPKLVADTFLEVFDLSVFELDDSTAAGTHEMVVVPVAEYVFVYAASFVKSHLADEPAFDQQRERPVHGSFRYARVATTQYEQQLLGTEMAVGREHSIEHLATCSRHLEMMFREKPAEPTQVQIVLDVIVPLTAVFMRIHLNRLSF